MTLPLQTRPMNVPKLHYTTVVQTKTPQTDADTNVLANAEPARRARVETETALNGLATPWCATPTDDRTHEHSRTPQSCQYKRDQPTVTNYTTLHLDKPRRH